MTSRGSCNVQIKRGLLRRTPLLPRRAKLKSRLSVFARFWHFYSQTLSPRSSALRYEPNTSVAPLKSTPPSLSNAATLVFGSYRSAENLGSKYRPICFPPRNSIKSIFRAWSGMSSAVAQAIEVRVGHFFTRSNAIPSGMTSVLVLPTISLSFGRIVLICTLSNSLEKFILKVEAQGVKKKSYCRAIDERLSDT